MPKSRLEALLEIGRGIASAFRKGEEKARPRIEPRTGERGSDSSGPHADSAPPIAPSHADLEMAQDILGGTDKAPAAGSNTNPTALKQPLYPWDTKDTLTAREREQYAAYLSSLTKPGSKRPLYGDETIRELVASRAPEKKSIKVGTLITGLLLGGAGGGGIAGGALSHVHGPGGIAFSLWNWSAGWRAGQMDNARKSFAQPNMLNPTPLPKPAEGGTTGQAPTPPSETEGSECLPSNGCYPEVPQKHSELINNNSQLAQTSGRPPMRTILMGAELASTEKTTTRNTTQKITGRPGGPTMVA